VTDLMKLYPFAFVAFSALVVGALPQPVKAKQIYVPFQLNCTAMQKYFNSVKWSVPTKFVGFESSSMTLPNKNILGNTFDCDGGYATEKSPMGTKVCDKVTISYDINGRRSWGNGKWQGTCRYK